ncbi:MAG: hypothetical protein J6C52_10190, partial [Clostridia bacterium]|nr:hypothetical protein [Clostridia bacterium]
VLNPLADAPYDIFPFSFYDDREKPTTMLLTVCDAMNRRWKFPHFSMELPSVMLAEIERQSGDRLPEVSGDMTDQWADFAAISPEWMGIKRRAMRRLLPAEMAETLRALDGGMYHADNFRRVIRFGGLFDEHCWATSSKHPQKMHLFNLNYVKRYSAEQADVLTEESLRRSIGTPDESVRLYNLLPRERCHPLTLRADEVPDGVAVQTVGDVVITEPLAFDAMESRVYPRRTSPIPASVPAPDTFETDFYRVVTNPTTHAVESIVEKSTGRELIDRNAPYTFGEYVYVTAADKNDGRLAFEVPKRREFTVTEGDAAYVITREGYEEQSGADVSARFIFHKHSPDIDLDLRFEFAAGLMGDFYERYRKAILFAPPFAVKEHRFYTQLSGGMAHEVSEKMRVCPMDYTIAEEWLAVEGTDGGIGIRAESVPLFHLSQINYNRFMTAPDFPRSHVYLYAASNRTNNLNFRTPEDCHGEFRLTIRPYAGHCSDALPAWSRTLAQPILAGGGEALPSLSLSEDLRLMRLRAVRSDALLLRFAEESGKSRENVRLTLPFRPIRAALTTLDGRETSPLIVDGNDVIFSIAAGSFATLMVTGSFCVSFEKEEIPPIHDIFTVNVENRRSIVCFEKADGLQAKGFRIIGDGEILTETENLPEAVQTVELPCRPKQIEIEIII